MASERRRRLHADRTVRDIAAGDFVRRVRQRGVGLVDSIGDDGYARVIWKNGRKDFLPLAMLRRVPAGGSDFDVRKWRP